MPQDYQSYGSSQDEGMGGKLSELAEGLSGLLKKFWLPIALILIIAGGALFYVYLLPKDSTVTVSVSVKDDSVGFDGAEVLFRNLDGKNLVKSKYSDAGYAVFENVPPGKAELVVDAQPSFDAYTEQVEIPSGAEVSYSVELVKKTKLLFMQTNIPTEFSPGCNRKVDFTIFNNSTAQEQVTLVADGILGDFLKFPKEATLFGSGDQKVISADLLVSPSAEEGEITGFIRFKGSSDALDKSFSVKKVDVLVTPESFNYNSRQVINEFLVITNNGENSISGLSYKFNAGSKACESCVSVAAFGDQQLEEITILPKDSTRLQIIVTPPSTPGKYLGELIIQAGCFSKSIPVTIDIPSEQLT